MNHYPDKADQELIQSFATLKSETEIKSFLRDLLTIQELKEAAKRFQIAKSLWISDKTYKEIATQFHTSTTTVTRVSSWLKRKKYGGYRTALTRLYPKIPKRPD